ncbi:hypothetical protein G195_007925 [Phytophthora kernoviae 00238/432]|uniref:Hexose transporter 1 n=1 Tax=Phytophthora kernoviae 00238/432 TaxID=1284355 RepID=A0A8J4SBF7_9STRA|nr:hypothetical protein G195_007925 [Phytophthora kernoviae 00238/432]
MAENNSYTEAASSKKAAAFDETNKPTARLIKPKTILYTSALLTWLQPFQSGHVPDVPGSLETEVNVRRERVDLRRHDGITVASVSNIWLFALDRLVADISSGTATVTIGGYGRKEEAEEVIARLYGEEHVQTVLSWLEVSKASMEEGLIDSTPRTESMLAPRYRIQLLTGILLSCAQQLSGINAMFYYSGSIFSDAGISDSRVSTLIITFINIWSAFFTGVLANRFGARNMILWGLSDMVVMSISTTLAFVVDVSALSIVFTALYVIVFGVTLGPLVWVMTAGIFPDSIRASASSLCIGINWLCNLVVGVAHPYI